MMWVVGTAALILTMTVHRAFSEPKGDEVTIKGEVIDVWCYLEGGDRGADHKNCVITCAKAGNPIGILDDK